MTDFDWDDIRAALAVARAGTVSGGADALGVHHATVIRRIDALEKRLRARLFQRHPRGYALTDAGRVLLAAAGAADDRFGQMAAQIAGAGDRIEGDLVITSLPYLAGLVMPRLIGLMRDHPGLRLRYLTDVRLYRLDTGEAHVAIRAGARPTEPDYVVGTFDAARMAIYAAPAYLDAHGPVAGIDGHRLCLPGPDQDGAPVMQWLARTAPGADVAMISNDTEARVAAIRAGLVIGPLPPSRADGLVPVMQRPEWESRLWLVTHVDLHRTPKVQAALAALRGAAEGG